MPGKQARREAKRARDLVREAQRRRERQRTLQTAIVVGIALALGGALIAVSIGQRDDSLAQEQASDLPSDPLPTETPVAAPAVPACVPEPFTATVQLPKPTFPDGAQQVLADGSNYRAVLETSCGRMVFQLLEDDAPETVNSFVFLARQGFFDGLDIFRNATSISALQTGAGDNTNTWDLGYTIPDEFARAEAEGGYRLGALAMAKSAAPDSGGSQFFMIYGDTSLPPEYTLFGQLVEGSEVLASIGAIPTQVPADPSNETPSAQVVIESLTIEETPGDALGPLAPVDTPPLPESTTVQPTEGASP